MMTKLAGALLMGINGSIGFLVPIPDNFAWIASAAGVNILAGLVGGYMLWKK